MAFKRRNYDRIVGLFDSGASKEVAIELFITMAETPSDAAQAISRFIDEQFERKRGIN